MLNTAAGELCDDGNSDDQDLCTCACEPGNRVVFLTSTPFDGALGGLDGADASCQALAAGAGFDGLFKAWLANGSSSPSSRMDTGFTGKYVRADGATIATGWLDLVDGMIDASIGITEDGEDLLESVSVW